MVRENKGTSVEKHIDDYCVVDLETTGIFITTSKIVEISALRVRNNQIVDEFSTLVNPQCHIPEDASAVNHITDDMVKDAPLLDDLLDGLLAFVGNDVIVGYNNASFDMNILYDCVHRIKNTAFCNNYIDILHAARRSIGGLENYRLMTVSSYYHLDTEGGHRALKDCYLTKCCYDKLFENYGNNAFVQRYEYYSGISVQFTSETLALQDLKAILETILSDEEITEREIYRLQYWMEDYREYAKHYPFNKVFDAIEAVLEDGTIQTEEKNQIKKVFSEIVDPVKCNCCNETIPSLKGKHVCLTGEFDYGQKSAVEEKIVELGGIVDSSVKKKATNYLIVGAQGSDAWKAGNYGGKIQKAMEYNSKGCNIKIVEEKEFIPRVEYLISHPEENERGCDC